MILTVDEIGQYRGQVTMVDGCFDPLHSGHVAYFKAASELGHPVLCNISDDAYLRTKHPPLLPVEDRAVIIDAIRFIAFTFVSQLSTAEVLRVLRPRFYAKGDDWKGRIPDEEVEGAHKLGIEIVYLPTVLDSSSRILRQFMDACSTATLVSDS